MIGYHKTRRAALALLVLLAACSGDDKETDQERNPDEGRTESTRVDAPADVNAAAYTEDIRTSFTRACTQQGGTEAYCGCMIERIAETLPIDDFVSYEQAIVGNSDTPAPAQITDAMRECVGA